MILNKIVTCFAFLSISPTYRATGYTNLIEHYHDFDISFVDAGSYDSFNKKYSVTIENSSDNYIRPLPFTFDGKKYDFIRENEPFYNPNMIVCPGKKEECMLVLPNEANVNNYVKDSIAYIHVDSNITFSEPYTLELPNYTYETHDRIFYTGDISNRDYDTYYEYMVSISYQGKTYNTLCGYDDSNRLYLDISMNTIVDDIVVNDIKAFRCSERVIEDRGEGNWLPAFFAIILFVVAAPFLFVIGAAIIAIILIVVIKKSTKKKTNNNINNYH